LFVFLFLFVLGLTPAVAELVPPTLVSPQNGDILQLQAPPNQLTFLWNRVADATGYVLILTGPPEFGLPLELEIEQVASDPISININNLVTGTYHWTVSALLGAQTVSSQPSFFTIQVGSIEGGDLPAPALLLLPESTILRGDSAQIHFQWTRVAGAQGYRLALSPPEGAFVDIPQPPSGKTVVAERPLTPFQAGTVIWKVTPYDAQNRLGTGSQERQFLFTPVDGQPWDLDDSQGPSPNDLFSFAYNWQLDFNIADLDGDGSTDAKDLLLMVQAQQTGTLPTPTPYPGFSAPVQVQPLTGAAISRYNAVFAWHPVIGALGYEFNLLDSTPNSNLVRVIEQSLGGDVTTTIGYLQPRPRQWRVRAYFGTGVIGPWSPLIPFTVVN
jgi:hypothetical protein